MTAIWAALSGARRGPDGKYPIRSEDDPALGAALYLQTVGARFALEQGARVGVTTSRRAQEARWAQMAQEAGGRPLGPRRLVEFNVRTIDPGEDVVRARLADADGNLSAECARAIGRWYQ